MAKFIGKLREGRKIHTVAYDTIADARTDARRRWHTNDFDVLEIKDDGSSVENGIYEAIRYVPLAEWEKA